MRKNAFTLPELLIVLLTISIIAVVCIPGIILGITNTRHQANYKRAYQIIHSLVSIEFLNGKLPTKADASGFSSIFEAIISKLDIKEFAQQKENGPDDGNIYSPEDFKHAVKFINSTGKEETKGDASANSIANAEADWTKTASPWVVTENNLAYSITGVQNEQCLSKEQLDNVKEISELNKNACAIIVVDVNGLATGPNKLDDQVIYGVGENKKMEPLIKDRFYIYIAKNGVAQGSKATSLSARLMNNMR